MKALSLWQPWASLLGFGKLLETRSWGWPSTIAEGDLLAIHAGASFPRAHRELCSTQPFLRELTRLGLSMPELPVGAIVSVVRVGISRPTDWWRPQLSERELALGDYSSGRTATHMHIFQQLSAPVPCRGHQRFWTLPSDIEEAVRAQFAGEPKPVIETECRCHDDRHFWPDDSAEGDTCECGQWYRFSDRIEATPSPCT